MTDIRITQSDAEILRKGDPDIRITQADVEILRIGDPAIRITQADVEVLRSLETGAAPGNFFLVF